MNDFYREGNAVMYKAAVIWVCPSEEEANLLTLQFNLAVAQGEIRGLKMAMASNEVSNV